ncbi:MAG TPA: hypothetical protein VJR06_00860, partial [Nitrososphaerales archaeon]|nr:hypothetical protein [Nitrososphaerales archaeon]
MAGFGPLTALRHASQLRRGTKTLLDALVEKIPDATDVTLWGRPELSAAAKEATGKGYNDKVYGQALFVNARARPTQELLSPASSSEPFVVLRGRELVAAKLETIPWKPGVIRRASVAALAKGARKSPAPPDPLFAGYWDLVESNGLAIAEQARRFEDQLSLPRSAEVRGPSTNVMVDAGADVEGQVTFDARLGPIVVERGASV